MKIAKYTVYAILVITIVSAISCSKQDRYIDILKGKEVVYTGKPDSLTTHSGRNRIGISWLLSSDPKITKAVIYWNNYKDSLVVPITRTAGVDSIGVIIPNLAIGVYNFVVYTYDKDNHKSVPVYTTGRVYGDSYEKHLVARRVTSAYRWNIVAGPLFIVWDKLNETTSDISIGAKLTYKDDGGGTHSQVTSFRKNDNDTIVFSMPANISQSAIIEYITFIKPDINALDTFYTAKETLNYSIVTPPSNFIKINEATSNVITVNNKEAIAVDKSALTIIKAINVGRVKLDLVLDYAVDIQLNTNNLPAGTTPISNVADISVTSEGVPVTKLNVQGNQSTTKLSISLPKSVLDANAHKKVAFRIDLANLTSSKFNVIGVTYSAAFVVDVDALTYVVDVTNTYIKNPGGTTPFQRSDAGTGQFGTIKDWKINVYVQKNNPTAGKRGFSTNNEVGGGYMYAARLAAGVFPQDTKPTEGKIYQNIALPADKYLYEMDFKSISFRSEVSNNAMYLAVIERDTLPATGLNNQLVFPGNISECIAYTKLNFATFNSSYVGNGATSLDYDYTAKMPFDLLSPKTVALGVVISYQNTNPFFLCRGVKLKKYLSLFD